jgi:hypothetical protein
MVIASAVILRSESRGTHDRILLSQIRDAINMEDQAPGFISSRNRVAQLYLQALGFLFVASYESQGYGGVIRPRLLLSYVTPFHGPHRNTISNSTSIVACASVAAGTCLPTRALAAAACSRLLKVCCLEANVVSFYVSRSLPSKDSTRYNI